MRRLLVILPVVAISRIAFMTGPYFADGPAHIRAIQSRAFVMTGPGYWLFNRIAGLSDNPAAAIACMNILFSVCGTVAFYLVARELFEERTAFWATAAYASVFYAWFAAEIHSTYESQFLFPVLVFYFLLQHRQNQRLPFLLAAAFTFAVGAGMRPSDGAFIGPMFCFYLFRADRKQAAIAFTVACCGCFAWLMPTWLGSHSLTAAAKYTGQIITTASPLVHPFRGLANDARFVVPLVAAFWPILGFIRFRRDEVTAMLWLWIIPGSLFFLLLYMSDATYLVFMTAPIILLACLTLRNRIAPLALCAVANVVVFLFFRPVAIHRLPVEMVNCYVGTYTRFALTNHWEKNLSEVMAQR